MSGEWIDHDGADESPVSDSFGIKYELKFSDGTTVVTPYPRGYNWNVVDKYREAKAKQVEQKPHSHYHKDVSHLTSIDVYRVLDLFGVTDQAIGHAAKKLLCAGQRGHKDLAKDIQDSIDTLVRWQEMRKEDMGND